jgi:hypothetical protein
MEDRLSRALLDGPLARGDVVLRGRLPRAYRPWRTFWGAFPVFLLRRRSRVWRGTVQRSAMIAVARSGVMGWPSVSRMT